VSWWARKKKEQELEEEVRRHLEMAAQERVARGATSDEARRAARREFGNVELVKETTRDAWGRRWLRELYEDARFGARMLWNNPGFTLVAVLTLALGIGANTAIFSALNTLLLGPLPVENVERLTFIVSLRQGFDPFGTSLLEYTAYRDRSHAFANCGLASERSFNLIQRGVPERIQGAAILPEYLTTLGVRPVIGRSFTPEEDRPGGPAVALLGYGLWKRRFAGDPQVVGQSLDLEGRNTTVIGILPPTFDLPEAAEMWIPLQTNLAGLPLAERAKHSYYMVARLKPGASLQQADADLKAIARELEQEFPEVRRGWGVKLVLLRQQLLGDLTGQVKTALFALIAAVGFLLFICCANVASLLLARGVSRERELALRRALGAEWSRIVRQLLTECLLLAVLGGAGGLLLAYAMVPALRVLNPIATVALAGVLRNIRIDWHVLGFVGCVTLITAVICALTPVAKAAGANDATPILKEGGERGSTGSGGRRWLATLVVAEIAIAMPLLAGGGLLTQSLQRLQRMDLGFRPENLLSMHLELSASKYPEYQQRVRLVERVVERVKNLPGVLSAGTTTNLPLTSFISYDAVFSVEGHPPANPSDVPITAHRQVSSDYLQTLGVTLIRGRLLNEQDRANGLPVVVISEELARQGWPDEDPVGKRIKGLTAGRAMPWLTVVGVIKDIKEDRFNFRVNRPAWYVPYEQSENTQPVDLVVKASGDPSGLTAAIVEAIRSVDPDQPVSSVTTMKEQVAGVLLTDRFGAVLMGALAALGLALAIIGVYGVMAYSVSRQTQEMGLRVALGARPGDILKMVVGRGARLVAAGLSLGLVGALILTRFLAGSLYGMNPNDPLTFGGVSLILAGVALGACYLPARRATKVDPMMALRHE
jgi:putative ABC transport system permease protein